MQSKSYQGTKDWCMKTMPQFRGKKAFVLPGAFYGSVVGLMAEAGFEKADTVKDADVVVFIGGADINPSLYGADNVASGGINKVRDELEVSTYQLAQKEGKICFGICRGAQFLHAMNGGRLWQDVNNHGGPDHYIVDIDEDVRVLATSIHHQMLQDCEDLEIIAVTEKQVATRFQDPDLLIDLNKGNLHDHEVEIEAGAFAKSKSFFVQGHPEVGSVFYRTWTMSKLHDLFQEWTDQIPTIKQVIERMVD